MQIKIREELLHYLWQLKKFDHTELKTTDGRELRIISYGHLNHNAGPDFLEGKIEIDGTLWAGHIEMHLLATDWHRHKHSDDPAYANVILHVVYHHDSDVALPDGSKIPTLNLENRISPRLIEQYQHLLANKSWIPCQDNIHNVNGLTKTSTVERMMAERLIEKSALLKSQLDAGEQDLSALIYKRLAYAMGLSVNAVSMEKLITQLPNSIIQKHRDDLFQLEALMLGHSGLIDNIEDDYANALLREYQVLAQKFGLQAMQIVEWKYSKLRPAAFPTLRIAQLAKLIHTIPRIDNLLLTGSPEEIKSSLSIKVDGYWKYHYRFGIASTPKPKSLGKSKIEVILINAVVPILWTYAELRKDEVLKEKAITLLSSIASEKNSITDKWKVLEMPHENAADSQGLIHLKKNYCDKRRCLHCPIGVSILS